ncbi:Hypothetical protein CINCED_3A019429 [Cinara cedri]|nr:Hypothetical protein CINCED_3A019429 [Cinara cedri]
MDYESDELLFCRFCLRQSQSSFPIFMASDPDLAKDVMNCLQVKITQDSVGPKHICNECYDHVQDWVTFKRQSEEALKEIESNMNYTEKDSVTVTQMDLIDEVDYHCCIYCEKIYPSEYELLMHVNEIHPKSVNYNTNPKYKENIMEYIQSSLVDGEENIQCDEYIEYNRPSYQKMNYEQYNELPTSDDGDEKFQCYYCSATFDEFVHLKEHSVSRHRDLNKKTECNKCNKIFLTVNDLQEHVTLTHPGKKDTADHSELIMWKTPKRSPYICNLCDKTFSRFCDLLDHDEIQHDDLPKRYRCGVCSKMFLMEDRAKVHYNFYHTKTKGTMNFQCTYCGMELKSASAVANHERMHITQKSTHVGFKIIRD